MTEQAEIGIFGGTGVYDAGLLSESKEITVETPFGKISDSITVGVYKGRKVAFMPRHGKKHTIPPHLINFRANIWAFKEMGVKRVIAPSAVGSLRQDLKPGDFVLPSQFIDFTKSRKYTFFEDAKVIHISVADPFCPDLQNAVSNAAKTINLHLKKDATYVCIEG
ncbi:MAG: MTAP family purine nucleoside phosphorylase, partial [Thaumarchaeota archaeon]